MLFRIFILIIFLMPLAGFTQSDNWKEFAVSKNQKYGSRNPEAPQQLDDFKPMIGTSYCNSLRRNPDRSWADTTTMIWAFKYILNGTAIQDETWSDGVYATSIRQFHADSNVWVVSYNSYPGISIKGLVWIGRKEGKEIILNQPQNAPNGMEGISRLTFTNISDNGFDWKGEWVNEEQGIVYLFWKIWCRKIDE